MLGSFLTRGLALVLGYAYPAYECYKSVELNKPDIEQLRFWCQYWILVAALTVFERVGDTFISWLPMYSEAKLAFFVYLWYPKTRGTSYVYETFFRPYVAKHETEIDRNLLELRTRAGDIVILYWQKAASYGQTRFFEILQYVAAQSQQQPSRPRPAQRQQTQQIRQTAPARQPAASEQQQPTRAAGPPPPPSPSKSQLQESTKAVNPPPAAAAQPQSSSGNTSATATTSQSTSEASSLPASGETESMQVDTATAVADDSNPPQETPVEEAIRMTRLRLRKRVAAAAPSNR